MATSGGHSLVSTHVSDHDVNQPDVVGQARSSKPNGDTHGTINLDLSASQDALPKLIDSIELAEDDADHMSAARTSVPCSSWVAVVIRHLSPVYLLPWRVPAPLDAADTLQRAATEHSLTTLGSGIAFMRIVMMVLWLSLIGLYFNQLNGSYSWVPCSTSAGYCAAQSVVFSDRCQLPAVPEGCTVDLLQTVPVLMFLTMFQLLWFIGRSSFAVVTTYTAQAFAKSGYIAAAVYFLASCALTLLCLCLFAMEAFVLPFDTQYQDRVAFAPFNSYGLHISALIAIAGVASTALLVPIWSRGRGAWKDTLFSWWWFLFGILAPMAALLHLVVAALMYAAQHADFVSVSMWFPSASLTAAERSFSAVRVLFTLGSILDQLLLFVFFNLKRRLAQDCADVFNGLGSTAGLVLAWPIKMIETINENQGVD